MRTDLLVHWTGAHQIDVSVGEPHDLEQLQPEQEGRYVAHLCAILQNGLYLGSALEQVIGRGQTGIGHRAPSLCFTEIRLSQVFTHAKRYGFLGIAVERRFVLERFGGPVHYVRNHSEEMVVANAETVGRAVEGGARTDPRLQPVFDAYSRNLAFIKAMSTPGTDDFAFLDEHEWRIVYAPEQQQLGRIVPSQSGGFTVLLHPVDVKLVVFPNDRTREIASRNQALMQWFQIQLRPPIFLTIRECSQF